MHGLMERNINMQTICNISVSLLHRQSDAAVGDKRDFIVSSLKLTVKQSNSSCTLEPWLSSDGTFAKRISHHSSYFSTLISHVFPSPLHTHRPSRLPFYASASSRLLRAKACWNVFSVFFFFPIGMFAHARHQRKCTRAARGLCLRLTVCWGVRCVDTTLWGSLQPQVILLTS